MAIDLYKNRCAVYDGDKPYIFVSYSHQDIERVVSLIRKLQSLGFRIWYDSGVPAGTEWREVIARKLKNSKCVLALLSKDATQSRDFKLELNYAYYLELPILVAYLDKCTPTPGVEILVVSQQCIKQEFCENDDDLLAEIARAQILSSCRDETPDVKSVSPPSSAPLPEIDDSTPTQNIDELLQKAETENPEAQLKLGLAYMHGTGVAQNYTEAANWLRKSAEQGLSQAQFFLGFCYDLGRGVTQNNAEAFKWYQKAAEQGNPWGQCAMGICYEYGSGVDQDWDNAARWYRAAAEHGNATAQEQMAKCYREGLGVPIDKAEADRWQKLYDENPDKD